MNDTPIHYEYGHKTILELRNLQEDGHLNLTPGFQRQSVWTMADRRKLIQSVLDGYPFPSIFLYRREENGMPIYDVLDGKQRLETIFMFSKVAPFKQCGFETRFQFSDDETPCWYDWKALEKFSLAGNFLTYKIQVAEVQGELSDIIELFVRINSTGKALTSSEKRHSRYYTSPFLKEAEKLARKHRPFLTIQKIISATQIDRMKDVEFVSEVLASMAYGGPIHKKQAIDKAIGNESINAHTLAKVVRQFGAAINVLRKFLPNLRTTRFRNLAELYTLLMVIWELQQQGLVLNDRRRNQAAQKVLQRFSHGVDDVREQQKKLKGVKPVQLYANYLMMVQQSTDALSQRTARAEIIRNLLAGLFEKKDEKRGFSVEQRRLLWNSDEKKKCSQCGDLLDWNNFQVDHIKAHSLGGKTELGNAALICQNCNASKGARQRAKRRNKAA